MISSSKCSQRQPHLRWMCSIVVLYFALFYSDAQTVTTVNPIVIKRDSNDFVTSIPWEVNSDTKIEFSVTPSDCVISPDPSQEATIGYNSIGGKFFTVTCPDPIAKATINFTPNRGDRQIVVDGDVTSRSAERNVTSIILSKKQTSVSNPYIQLRELHLCNNMTSTALCKDFQINVGFSHVFPPVLTQIRVLKAPTSFKLPHFTPGCEAYQIKLFQNVPVTFVLQSDPNHRIFVDSNPSVPNVSKGFISSTQFLNFRPRVEPGMTENVTVYAATYDRSLSRSYTIMVTTVQSSESHLASLSVSPGRLEPEFSPYVFSYFARVPEGHEKFTIQLSGLDDVHTVCVFNHDKPIVVTGQGEATVYLPSGTQPGSHTVVITCTSQDQSSQIRYTLILVPNKGGSTLLKDLDIIGGELDRPFDPLNHGPYLANLELQGRQDQGWISFVGHASNPRATVTVEYVPFDKTSGTSPWFRIERGELRRFRIAVRTPENPVEEEYFVHVDRRGKWYEASSWTRKMADLFGWTSVVASMGSAPAFLQNMHLMQFISLSNRLNGKPESYDVWSEGFNKWNFQWSVPFVSKSQSEIQIINKTLTGHSVVIPPEPNNYIINALSKFQPTSLTKSKTSQMLKNEISTLLTKLANQFLTLTKKGEWIPSIDLTLADSASVAANVVGSVVTNAFETSANPAAARRHLAALNEEDKLRMIREINATYKQQTAIRDYMSSIVFVTLILTLTAIVYAVAEALAVRHAIKGKDGIVRDMPKVLHPVRFWSFVFDIILIAYAQSGFGILACPSSLRNTKFIIFGFIPATPKGMIWFAGLILLGFPLAYLCFVGWVLITIKKNVVFSKDLNRYQKKDMFLAKAENRVLPWLPIIPSLFAVEIRDVFPIFRPGHEDVDDMKDRPSIVLVEENRKGGPCNVDAPEFGRSSNQQDPITCRNKTNDQHYAMLSQGHNEDRIRYHPDSDELKVSFAGLRMCHSSDSGNALVYNKYPNAEIGRKCFKVRNPYGLELDCHALLQLKHLSNLWQMSELPHHFHFWIKRRNCQALDFDGWNLYYDSAHCGNFMYYLIDRIAFLSIVGLIVFWGETSGFITGLVVIGVSLALALKYTPAAIESGTSKWFSQMEEELRIKEKEVRFEESEKTRQNRWPFKDQSVKKRVDELQCQKEALDYCGHGGWYARNQDCGLSKWSLWHYRSHFCFREWITGAPGLELSKCLILTAATLGNSKVGALRDVPAFVLAFTFACLGSICLNYTSIVALLRELATFKEAFVRFIRRTTILLHDTFRSSDHLGGRFMHLFNSIGSHLNGVGNTSSFDYPRALGERIRDFEVLDCNLVADEVGLFFSGPLKPSDLTCRLEQRIGSRHTEPYGLIKTLHISGPLGAHRANLDDTFPVRLPFRDFYLGKLSKTQGVSATIHVVNHGFRSQLTDRKERNVFTSEDDSYLSLYRDPRFLPEWGVVRNKNDGHGYVIQYDRDSHSLMIKGPSLREGVEYHVQTETSKPHDGLKQDEDDVYSVSDESVNSEGGRCIGEASCTASGTLYVPVPHSSHPSLYDPIEIQSPEGDRFSINPNDIKVHYDSVSRELTLRHRLFVESDDQSVYRVAWIVGGPGVPIKEKTICQETGVLHISLTKRGIPDLRSLLSFTDSNGDSFKADPKETDAHRVSLPTNRDPRGFGLVVSRFIAKFSALKRRISGNDSLRDSVESSVPCTVVQCVNPNLGQYRVEPNFREAMKSIRAQVHSLEAQRSQLDDIGCLATTWPIVMSLSEFSHFWKSHGINIVPAEGMWLNPLRDIHEPLVKSQFSKIESVVPKFRSAVQRLFATLLKELESDLYTLSQWIRAYDDVGLYGAQLQKDFAEMGGCNSSTGLESYARKVTSFKQQYESQIPNFIYPFVVEERHLTRMPNMAAQLRQWQRQLAVWLRAEEDAPLMNIGLGATPRSISSTGSEHIVESASLERTVMDVMHALKANLNRLEDPASGKFRSVLHYVTDSLSIRGPYTNWRPDPISGHVALVRVWHAKSDGSPDFERDPVWNPCCVKLSANAIKILLPGKDDVNFRFSTPYYWSHVLGHSIQLDCLEALEVSEQSNLPTGHASNLMLKAMPGQLVCRLTSALQLRHVGDQHIRLVENGAPGHEILMRREGAEEEGFGSSPRSTEGDAYLISLGKRMQLDKVKHLPVEEVRIANGEAQVYPLTFRFGERFIRKWFAVVKSAQMDKPPLKIDDQFGLPLEPVPVEDVVSEYSESSSSVPMPAPHEEQVIYKGDWQNYRYHGKGRLMDSNQNEIYNGDWKEGKRWGKGRYIFRDSRGLQWRYEGEFVDDEMFGKGRLTLIDENELKRLKSSINPKDRQQIVDFAGEIRGLNRKEKRGYTAPLEAEKPNLPVYVLKQLFDQNPSRQERHKPLIIDVRRAISCADDTDVMKATLGDVLDESFGSSPDSHDSYETAKDEYLPHRTRWTRSLDASLGFERLEGRLALGTIHFADGAVYHGALHNGVPHGKGGYMSSDETVKCEGNWSRGVPHGYAVLTETKKDGSESSYFGTFINGKRSGNGIQTSKNGLIYVEGLWLDDTITNSEETLINVEPEGVDSPRIIVKFRGRLVDGLPDGEGTVKWADGVTYRGELSRGKRHGHGVMRNATKRVVVSSSWKDDLPHGRVARLVQSDGKVYTGDIFEGKRQGIGELYHSEKGEPFFEGLFLDNMAHGRGTLYTKDGVYEGEFQKGQREGKGTFEYSENPSPKGDQRLYVGDWKNDLPHGLGNYRDELGINNTYKFDKGQLDRTSVKAYKSGMCGKVPLIGVAPTVSPSNLSHTGNTYYGEKRPLNPEAFGELLNEEVKQPLWRRLVVDKPMAYVDPEKAPQRTIRPATQPPSRPISEDGSNTPGDFQTESPVRKRLLQVSVIHGRNLPVLEGNFKPYVKVIIGKEMKKTKVFENGGHSPQWNSFLNFPLRREQKALIEIWDQDLQNLDRFVATGEIDLISFLTTNNRESSIIDVDMYRKNLDTGKDELSGILSIRFSIIEMNQDVGDLSSDDTSVQQVTTGMALPIPPPCVHIQIREGRDLPNMDIVKKMDPYVKISIGKEFRKTKVQKKAGINPKFNEEFYLPFIVDQKLILEVFDKDTLSSDDFVGRAEIDLPLFSFSGSVPLRRPDKKGSIEAGVLDVSINTIFKI